LTEAVAEARTWVEVLHRLRLADGGGNRAALQAHARRLSLDTTHLGSPIHTPVRATDSGEPKLELLRTAGNNIAASWFLLRGYEVLWPLEPCRYDLAVRLGESFERIQVKTTTFRSGATWIASLANSRREGQVVYGLDEIDSFFVIDAELNAYLIPLDRVAGRRAISLNAYRAYRVAERGQWLAGPAAAS
jgi:hypothetical protein